MEAIKRIIPPAEDAVRLPAVRSKHPHDPLPLRRRTTPAVGDALADGLARLVEGQRQFAEELGLPYGRVFSDGFEGFKSQDASHVIKRWFADPELGADRLQMLFDDLISHQVAVIAAVDGAVLRALNEVDAQSSQLGRSPWAWMVRRLLPRRRRRSVEQDQTLRYLHLVAPAFVAAYAQAREGFGQQPLQQDQ
jgi:hypothetical protein